MSKSTKAIIPNIERLLESVATRLPPENIADARELLEHDEWGVVRRLATCR